MCTSPLAAWAPAEPVLFQPGFCWPPCAQTALSLPLSLSLSPSSLGHRHVAVLARPPGPKEFGRVLWPWAQRITCCGPAPAAAWTHPTACLLLFGGAIHRLALPASWAPPARLLPWSLRDPAPQEEEEKEHWLAVQASSRWACAAGRGTKVSGCRLDKWAPGGGS